MRKGKRKEKRKKEKKKGKERSEDTIIFVPGARFGAFQLHEKIA